MHARLAYAVYAVNVLARSSAVRSSLGHLVRLHGDKVVLVVMSWVDSGRSSMSTGGEHETVSFSRRVKLELQ